MSTENLSNVYVVLVNRTAIHSICSTEIVAKEIVKSTPGLTVHTYPLVSKLISANIGVTENTTTDDNAQVTGVAQSLNNNTGSSPTMSEGSDIICVDVPLAIRLFEYAREEARTDEDVHILAERLVQLGTEKDEVLTMDHYSNIVSNLKSSKPEEFNLDDLLGDNSDINVSDDTEDDIHNQLDDEFADKPREEEDHHIHDFGDDVEYQPQRQRFDPRSASDNRRTSMVEQYTVLTLADFVAPEVTRPDTKVPTIKDLYKQKAGAKRSNPEHFRSMLIQDPVTTAFTIAPNTTNQA